MQKMLYINIKVSAAKQDCNKIYVDIFNHVKKVKKIATVLSMIQYSIFSFLKSFMTAWQSKLYFVKRHIWYICYGNKFQFWIVRLEYVEMQRLFEEICWTIINKIAGQGKKNNLTRCASTHSLEFI